MKSTDLNLGERFTFKGFEWVVLNRLGTDAVLCVMASIWKELPFDDKEDYSNNYRTSTVREALKELLPILGENNLMPFEVDLVADNGDKRLGCVDDRVFLLTCDDYRKYREYMPTYDGWVWTATPWWLDSAGAGYGIDVRIVDPAGQLYNDTAHNTNGVAPACVLNLKNLKSDRQVRVEEMEG